MFQCQYVSIIVTLFTAFKVANFTDKNLGVFWRFFHTKMFYKFRTEKNADFQTIKNKKFYANKKISEKTGFRALW